MNIPKENTLVRCIALIVPLAALVLFQTSAVDVYAQDSNPSASARVAFVEQSDEYGVNSFTPTFGYIVADFNGDGLDDILGSHHGKTPVLLINIDGERFEDMVHILPLAEEKDVHCPAAADLDNDGDVDIILAGGGEGYKAARGGTPNQLFRNLLVETGELAFEAVDARIEFPAWRTRALIPHPTPNGKNISLLMQCIEDKNHNKPNLYFQLKSSKKLRFKEIRNNGFKESVHTEGNGLFADMDNDGDVDFLTVVNGTASIYYYDNGRFEVDETAFDVPNKANSITAGDLNNDGLMDVIVGRAADRTGSDIFTTKKQLIQFDFNIDEGSTIDIEEESESCDCDVAPATGAAIARRDDTDTFSFVAKGDEISINFAYEEHKVSDNPSIVYIGKDSTNPESAETTITRDFAFGRPVFNKAGVYIWFAQDRWNVHWFYSNKLRTATGQIFAKGIKDVEFEDMELSESEIIQDLIYINKGEGVFERIDVPAIEHNKITQALLALDFDNSGTVDIAMLRRGPRMAENGDPELFFNTGVNELGVPQFERLNTKDFKFNDNDTFSAESLIAGLFDDNMFFDLFSTNGQGLKPNEGPRHLFINATINDNIAAIIQLEPTVSNRDALGTKIWLRDGEGTLLGYREVFYQGRNQLNASKVHFGLGLEDNLKKPIMATIRWPNGTEQEVRAKPGKIISAIENQN